MRRDSGFRPGNIVWQCAILCVAFMVASACGNDGQANRRAELAAPAAQRLVGTWSAQFWLDRNAYVQSTDTTTVSGTISLEEDTYGRVSVSELANATHAGVYDLDFSKFGFEARESNAPPAAIARVSSHTANGVSMDSLTVVLSPGTALVPVVMNGFINGDSVVGQWTASAYRAGGASGHFTMRRFRNR